MEEHRKGQEGAHQRGGRAIDNRSSCSSVLNHQKPESTCEGGDRQRLQEEKQPAARWCVSAQDFTTIHGTNVREGPGGRDLRLAATCSSPTERVRPRNRSLAKYPPRRWGAGGLPRRLKKGDRLVLPVVRTASVWE